MEHACVASLAVSFNIYLCSCLLASVLIVCFFSDYLKHSCLACFIISVGCRRTNIRWWQKGGMGSSFAIDDVHIGAPCHMSCSDHSQCVGASCKCDERFNGECLLSLGLSNFVTVV